MDNSHWFRMALNTQTYDGKIATIRLLKTRPLRELPAMSLGNKRRRALRLHAKAEKLSGRAPSTTTHWLPKKHNIKCTRSFGSCPVCEAHKHASWSPNVR